MSLTKLDSLIKLTHVESGITISIIRDGLNKTDSASLSLFVSRSMVPLGREAALLGPKDSTLDKQLVKLHQQKSREFGEVLTLAPTPELADAKCTNLIAAVVPRDNIRRDETRQLLFGAILSTLEAAAAHGTSVALECLDGNKIFGIPQQHIAETTCEAVIYFCRREPKSPQPLQRIALCSSSNTLASLYAATFKSLAGGTLEIAATATANEAINAYGERMRALYNGVGSASAAGSPKTSLYDYFTALERSFGKDRSPATLVQIKRYLREMHNATDSDLDAIVARRKKECLAVLPEVLESVKLDAGQFFRKLCASRTGPIMFCREVLIDSIRELLKGRPFISDESELQAYFIKYCGVDDSISGDSVSGSSRGSLKNSKQAKHMSDGRARHDNVIGAASMPEIKPFRAPPKPPLASSDIRNARSPPRTASMVLPSTDSIDGRKRGTSSATTTPVRSRTMVRSASGGAGPTSRPASLRDISGDVPQEMAKFAQMVISENSKLITCLMTVTDTADLDKLAAPLTRAYAYAGDALTYMRHGIQFEISMTVSPSTLLRSNSLVTKSMTFMSKLVGKQYITDLVKPLIDRIVADPSNLEVDATRLKDPRLIESNRTKLKSLVTQLMDDMKVSAHKLPYEFRKICNELRTEVGRKFPQHINVAIAGYLCLRIINPAVAAPETVGIIETSAITPEIRRGCILVSKIFQNIANNLEFKEQFMTHFNSFVRERFDAVQQFLSEAAIVPESSKPSPVLVTREQFVQDVTMLRTYFKNALPKLQRVSTDHDLLRELEIVLN